MKIDIVKIAAIEGVKIISIIICLNFLIQFVEKHTLLYAQKDRPSLSVH